MTARCICGMANLYPDLPWAVMTGLMVAFSVFVLILAQAHEVYDRRDPKCDAAIPGFDCSLSKDHARKHRAFHRRRRVAIWRTK